jgi:hypothetical protein
MSAEAIRRAPIMPLRQLVDKYLVLAGAFGAPVALTSFGLTAPELENLFSAYNEDYHISRFFHFSNSSGPAFSIDNEPATHIAMDSAINSIL